MDGVDDRRAGPYAGLPERLRHERTIDPDLLPRLSPLVSVAAPIISSGRKGRRHRGVLNGRAATAVEKDTLPHIRE